jgi:glycerophosphoryl diester phosphodiesterase
VEGTTVHCIAHRGFAGVAPENTLAAVRAAVSRADGVEFDVRRCESGELVVCHDDTVDRTTDGSGAVADHTADELAALSVEGSGSGVPTARAVLEAIPPDVVLHAELKERVGPAFEALVADVDPDCDVVVSSFDPGALEAVDSLARALAVAEADDAIERARELDCAALHPAVDLCDEPLVDRAREAGLAVNAWTVTDPDETRRLRDLGVDGVITDFPACCLSAE